MRGARPPARPTVPNPEYYESVRTAEIAAEDISAGQIVAGSGLGVRVADFRDPDRRHVLGVATRDAERGSRCWFAMSGAVKVPVVKPGPLFLGADGGLLLHRELIAAAEGIKRVAVIPVGFGLAHPMSPPGRMVLRIEQTGWVVAA